MGSWSKTSWRTICRRAIAGAIIASILGFGVFGAFGQNGHEGRVEKVLEAFRLTAKQIEVASGPCAAEAQLAAFWLAAYDAAIIEYNASTTEQNRFFWGEVAAEAMNELETAKDSLDDCLNGGGE